MRRQARLNLNPSNDDRLRALAQERDLPLGRVADDLLRRGFETLPDGERAAVEARIANSTRAEPSGAA